MSQVLLVLLGTFLCIGIGIAIGHTMGSGSRGRADAVQKDFDEYKAEVKEHFAQTAEHFQTIGREYRALYDHMAVGANSLLDLKEADARLSFDPQPAADDKDAEPVTEEAVAESGESVEEAAEADSVTELEAEVEAVAAAAAEVDEDSTPDERARASGNESAPAGDEEVLEAVDEAPETVEEVAEAAESVAEAAVIEAGNGEAETESAEVAAAEAVDAEDKPAEDAAGEAPEVLVDESAKSADDAERTLH